MKLKEKYQNIDIEKTLIDNLEKGDFAKVKGRVTSDNLEKMNKSLELIKKNNWEETYIVLYFLLDKMNKANIKLKIKSTKKGVISAIQDISIILFTALSINDDGQFKELSIGTVADEYNRNNVIIETSEQKTIIEFLDSICTEWQDIFIIAEEQKKQDLCNIIM